MRVHHIQVSLVDWQVNRLAHRAARVMQVGRHVAQLDEVAEVFDGGITPSPIEVGHERRAIAGHEDDVVAAEGGREPRLTAHHVEGGGRRRAKRTGQPLVKANARSTNACPCLLEKL